MPRTRTLTSHAAIQDWVRYRNGQPAVTTVRNTLGHPRQLLKLAFQGSQSRHPTPTDMSPCSWNAWFAELDRQQLALKVVDSDDDDIQPSDIAFVSRETLN